MIVRNNFMLYLKPTKYYFCYDYSLTHQMFGFNKNRPITSKVIAIMIAPIYGQRRLVQR